MRLVRKAIAVYTDGEVDDFNLGRRCLQAGQGASAREIVEFLDGKQREKNGRYRWGAKNGPQKPAWFVAIVREEFRRRSEQREARKLRIIPLSRREPARGDPAFDRMTAAIELPDAGPARQNDDGYSHHTDVDDHSVPGEDDLDETFPIDPPF